MSSAVASTKSGKVQGIKLETQYCGAEYYAFYGIPYAQPPIGDLRFKNPVKVKPWKCIRDATKERDGCAQISLYSFEYQGTEDCLYVNVYTPKLPSKDEPLKAVMVNIPPGGLQCGSPDPSHQGNPDFIMHNDIVYVSICHRLHILGFLNLNMNECPGNMGLADMIMALEWVKENIQSFGGDPHNITAIGSSSGATMIHAFLLLPTVPDLFHKAILMGDYIFNNVLTVQTDNENTAFEFARSIGFVGDNPKHLLSFLKQVPVNVLVAQLKAFQNNVDKKTARVFPSGRFLPTLDPKSKHSLVPENARKFIGVTKKMPIIFGQCQKEAVIGFTKGFSESTVEYFRNAGRQNCWGWMHNLTDDEMDAINDKIDSYYFGNLGKRRPVTVQVDVLTDMAFSEIYDTVINPAAVEYPSSVYCYKFEYVGEIALVKHMVTKLLNEAVEGTFHSDDFSYWCRLNEPLTERTKKFIRMFTKLISNFAKTGNPNDDSMNEEWKPTSPDKPCYLRINEKPQMIDGPLNGNRTEFWDDIKRQYRRDL